MAVDFRASRVFSISILCGFTLVELLVVVAIIAILMALLAPALDKAVGYALEARCLANLHQIGIGAQMYTGAYRGCFPPKYMPGTTTAGRTVQTYVAGGRAAPGLTNPVSIYWWIGTAGTALSLDSQATQGNPTSFDKVGADKRYLNPFVGYNSPVPDTPMPIARCPGEIDKPDRYELLGTSYASNHNYGFSSLLNRQTLPTGADAPINYFVSPEANYAGIRVTRVMGASRLVVGGDTPGVLAGWNNSPAKPMPAWHRPDTYALLFVDAHAAMETFEYGEKTGAGYTFDETGRE